MLKLFGRTSSVNTQKSLWAIHECGVSFEFLDTGKEVLHQKEFCGLLNEFKGSTQRNLQIPMLETESGRRIFDSSTIARYLCMEYKPALFGNTNEGLAECSMWMSWVETMRIGVPNQWLIENLVRKRPELRNSQTVEQSLNRGIQYVDWLNRHLLDKKFVCGDHFTVADVPWGAEVNRWFMFDLKRPEMPGLERWYDRLLERPAFLEAVVKNEEIHHSQKIPNPVTLAGMHS